MTRLDCGAAWIVAIVLISAGCGLSPTPPDDTHAPPVGTTYLVTLTASPRCAEKLPEAARERTYTATLTPGGWINWNGPTLHPPSGHATIASGTISQTSFTFSVDVPHDPQDDGFNGIWDDMGAADILNISGKGAGIVEGDRITGTLDGTFAFFEGAIHTRAYCSASDHRFTFIRQ